MNAPAATMNPAETPFSFGDAARLYSENAAVVAAIREAFSRDVDAFLDGVKVEVERVVFPLEIKRESRGRGDDAYVSWRMSGKGDRDSKVWPVYVWFYTRRPEIVVPGQLVLNVRIMPPMRAKANGLRRAADNLEMPVAELGSTGKDGGRELFSATVAYPGTDQPVRSAAAGIASVLKAIRSVEKSARTRRIRPVGTSSAADPNSIQIEKVEVVGLSEGGRRRRMLRGNPPLVKLRKIQAAPDDARIASGSRRDRARITSV